MTPTFRTVESLSVRLSYADCDPAQIIYFAAWFPWMERLQSAWMLRHGLRQDELMERFGFGVVTRAAECEYLERCGLFDEVKIDLGVERVGRTSVTWAFRMTRADGAQVATATMTLVSIGGDGHPIPVPPPLLTAVAADLGSH